jgi:hypothetical protein
VGRLAEKIGKSERYVYDRLTLAGKLIPESREAGAAGWITASHLVELARLQAEDQAKALNACLMDEWWSHPEPDELAKTMEAWRTPVEDQDDDVENRVMSVRQLQNFIATVMKKEDPAAVEDDGPTVTMGSEDNEPAVKMDEDGQADEPDYMKDREQRQKRADKENDRRQALLKELVGKVRGPMLADELLLLCQRACGAHDDQIHKIAGVDVMDPENPEGLRKLLMVALVCADRNYSVNEWQLCDDKDAPTCESLEVWADVLGRVQKSEAKPAPSKMSGVEVVKKIKAGAKAMKVKVGSKKKGAKKK